MVPYDQNPHFVGRDDILSRLRAKLQESNPKQYKHRIAIYGMGGVGKTQVAIQYVYRYRNVYSDIFWISAANQAALLSGFQEMATMTACIPSGTERLNTIDVAKQVLSWLRVQENWLLVIDNLDDVSVADGYLPRMDKGGHTLITTRNPDATRIPAEGLEIPVLGRTEAVELLLGSSEGNAVPSLWNDALMVVDELGHLPLAIDQASALIRSLGDITKFLTLYRSSRKQVSGAKDEQQSYISKFSCCDFPVVNGQTGRIGTWEASCKSSTLVCISQPRWYSHRVSKGWPRWHE
jgi:nucleoside-triphosphatase THEP1